MSYLTGPRGRWLLAVVIVATALAGCMMPQVAPEPAPQADEEIVTMYVGPVQADCVGEGPQKCLLVKEGSPDGPYLMFYSEIEGFEWEEGYHYELQVRKTKVENPPAGGSSIRYELVQVVNKTPAGEVSTMYVAPMMVECETTEIYKCLLVSDSPDGEYRPFYGKISGFDYEEGYQYSLLVEEVPMDQPPSDAPAGVWNLLAVTQKTPATTVAAPEAQTPLEGTLWQLTSYVDANGQTQTTLAGSEVTATFQDGRVVGSAGCNNYTAEYTLDGSALAIGPAATTLRACISEELSAQEAAYLSALAAVASYEISGETLTLLDAAGQTVLEFAAKTPTSLTGTTWQVTNYNNGKQAVVTLLADTELTMMFDDNGQVSGSAGCNNFTGGYTMDGDAIVIGPLATTMKMCGEPEGVMEQEAAFLAALEAATTFAIQGDEIELRDDSGALQVRATAAAVEPPAASTATPLEGTLWVLTSYMDANGNAVKPIEGSEITLTFEEGRLGGNASCNNYGADYAVDGNTLSIGPVITTMMMCQPEALAQQEHAYLANLARVIAYEIVGDSLALADPEGNDLLTYKASTPTSLTGTTWQVTNYNNGKQAVVTLLPGTEITMTFGEGGLVSGTAGCNTFRGGYTVDGDAISVGPLASTMMLCVEPEGVMEQERPS
jgi:heat shock protein HslJ